MIYSMNSKAIVLGVIDNCITAKWIWSQAFTLMTPQLIHFYCSMKVGSKSRFGGSELDKPTNGKGVKMKRFKQLSFFESRKILSDPTIGVTGEPEGRSPVNAIVRASYSKLSTMHL